MSGEVRYKLLDDGESGLYYCRVDFKRLAFVVSGATSAAFIFCIVHSLVYNFESSTSTQCRAHNVLPSVSAAIGGYSPQREIWKVAICFQALPRLMIVYYYVLYNTQVLSSRSQALVFLAAVLYVVENLALISLSLFDSSHHYPIHEKSFITFILASELHMLLTVFLQHYHRVQARNSHESHSLKMKKCMVAVNIGFILFATYFFIVHNMDCPDFAYTKFAISEYIVVFSNIAFHYTAVYDFYGKALVWDKYGLEMR